MTSDDGMKYTVEMTHTVERPGMDAMKATIRMESNQALLLIDQAVVCLHAAEQALRSEKELCVEGTERAASVTDLYLKVRDAKGGIEKIGR